MNVFTFESFEFLDYLALENIYIKNHKGIRRNKNNYINNKEYVPFNSLART